MFNILFNLTTAGKQNYTLFTLVFGLNAQALSGCNNISEQYLPTLNINRPKIQLHVGLYIFNICNDENDYLSGDFSPLK